jgi:hypothetical protein
VILGWVCEFGVSVSPLCCLINGIVVIDYEVILEKNEKSEN